MKHPTSCLQLLMLAAVCGAGASARADNLLANPSFEDSGIPFGQHGAFVPGQITVTQPSGHTSVVDNFRLVAICLNGCCADINSDGQVDFFDYLDFVAAFNDEDIAADFNGDATIDFFDYLDFVAAFDAGCD